METVTISPKFQVVIPKRIREKLNLAPGQKVQAVVYGDRIELIPVRPVKRMRGFLKGLDTTVAREADRLWRSSIRAPGWSTSPTACPPAGGAGYAVPRWRGENDRTAD